MIMIYPSQDIMKFSMKLGCTLMLCARTQKYLRLRPHIDQANLALGRYMLKRQ